MKILVIGSGGREHTLVWKLAQSTQVETVYCAPGNDGMDPDARRIELSVDDTSGLLRFVADAAIDLTVIGPEAPLVSGVVDAFRSEGRAVVGPSAAAACLEGSKIFAKEFMARHGIPTARCEVFSAVDQARDCLLTGRFTYPVVIKADGLAAGKGVIIAAEQEEAIRALGLMMRERLFGAAGDRVVIEEYLEGEEASFMVFSDGRNIIPMVPSQDHKAVDDDDQGPNTGGMGAYSDDRILSSEQRTVILNDIIRPTIQGMAAEGNPFTGILYAGLMLTAQGPRVLEYNVRFGDPETQVVLPRLQTDLVDILQCLVDSRLDCITPEWDDGATVCVVLASEGYPGSYPKGREIHGIDTVNHQENVTVFHAGTVRRDGRYLTAGGRVLGITARGRTLQETIDRAYRAVDGIRFEGMHFRRDIGRKGLRRYAAEESR